MKKRVLNVGVSTVKKMFERARKVAKKLDSGANIKVPYEGIHFASVQLLLKVITPGRMQLVTTVKQHGPMSIRALAKFVERDYRNVHADVVALHKEGLLVKDKDSRYSVPWDEIVIKAVIPLGASA